MIYKSDCTLTQEYLEQLAEQGLEGLPDLVRVLINQAMQIERENYLGVKPYERSEDRQGHSNGYKPKTVKTRVGEVTFDIPQVREGGFYPNSLEKGIRSERAWLLTVAEMYVQGVSTRKVAAITERLCGTQISASQVSRAAQTLDEELESWRNRPLGEIVYLYLDARYEKVRQTGSVRDAAILIASGVKRDGKRTILGISVSLSEAEAHWRSFMEGLVKRGLHGIMRAWKLRGKQSSQAYPGKGASFTCSKMHKRIFPRLVCAGRWRRISEQSSTPRIGKLRKST